jgi:hypothetical protein
MGWNRSIKRKQWSCLVVSAVLAAASLAACEVQPRMPQGPAASPSTTYPIQSGIATITPDFNELAVDHSTGPAATVPWHLIRVDHQENRIYLSASSAGCTTPEKVRLTESDSSITITVTGPSTGEPCTAQHLTLLGYVQVGSIGDRQVTGNSS